MKKIFSNNKYVLMISIVVLVMLSVIKKVYVFEYKYNAEDNLKIRAMVISKEKETEDKVSYIIKYDNNNFLFNIYNNKTVDKVYSYGDVLEFRGSINKIETMGNPYEFDYKKYLNSNNIVTTISTYNGVKCIGKKNGNLIFEFCYMFRDLLDEKISKYLPEREANLYKSMIYGNDICLAEDIKENFKKNGLSHMLAVSGHHLMYLVTILDLILKKSNVRKAKIIYYILILGYLVISGMSISAIRASIMSILVIANGNNNENSAKKKYINIAISYIILVIHNPYVIFSVSGVMSYLATIGIITFNSLIYSFFEVKLKVPKVTRGIFKILSTTISSLILLFPVQIYYFGVIELRLFISCVITNCIFSFIYLIGFISLFLSFVPVISNILFNSIYFLLFVVINLTDFLANINIPSLSLPKPSLFELYLYYLSIFLVATRKYSVLIRKRKIRQIWRGFVRCFAVISFAVIFSLSIYRIYFEEYVIYFNVGQGNMSLIRKDRKVIVIDCGSTSEKLASNILNNFLKAKAINNIDLVILTHFHTDHMNGIYDIEAKIDKIGYSIPKEENVEYEKFSDFLIENNISKVELKKDDKISFKNITIDILLPYANKVIKSDDIANSNSIVALVSIKENNKNINLVYMGDATIETEKVLLNNITNDIQNKFQNISVLQVGHHGSKTSTSDNFLQILNVKLAVISSKKKVYGHPAKETLDKLNKYNIRYKITENNGAVVLKI